MFNLSLWLPKDFKILQSFCNLNEGHIKHVILQDISIDQENLLQTIQFDYEKYENLFNNQEEKVNRIKQVWNVDTNDLNALISLLTQISGEISEENITHTNNALSVNNAKICFLENVDLITKIANIVEEVNTQYKNRLTPERFSTIRQGFENKVNDLSKRREELNSQLSQTNEFVEHILKGTFETKLNETNKENFLSTLKGFDQAILTILLTLKSIEDLNNDARTLAKSIEEDVKAIFATLREEVANHYPKWSSSQASIDSSRIINEEFVRHLIPEVTGIAWNAYQSFVSRFRNLEEKLKLQLIKVDAEPLHEGSFSGDLENILKDNSKALLPYYLYNLSNNLTLLQVLDSTHNRYRLAVYGREPGHNYEGKNVQNVRVVLAEDLRNKVEKLDQFAAFCERYDQKGDKLTQLDILLALGLYRLDNEISEDQEINELTCDNSTLNNYINFEAQEKQRRVPEEPKVEEPKIEEPVQAEPEQPQTQEVQETAQEESAKEETVKEGSAPEDVKPETQEPVKTEQEEPKAEEAPKEETIEKAPEPTEEQKPEEEIKPQQEEQKAEEQQETIPTTETQATENQATESEKQEVNQETQPSVQEEQPKESEPTAETTATQETVEEKKEEPQEQPATSEEKPAETEPEKQPEPETTTQDQEALKEEATQQKEESKGAEGDETPSNKAEGTEDSGTEPSTHTGSIVAEEDDDDNKKEGGETDAAKKKKKKKKKK